MKRGRWQPDFMATCYSREKIAIGPDTNPPSKVEVGLATDNGIQSYVFAN